MRDLTNEILELIRRTLSSLPKDVEDRLQAFIEKEQPGSAARGALETMLDESSGKGLENLLSRPY
jgi:tartrate dehydratase alpha subunit/fumarate hydratase class I-like protein